MASLPPLPDGFTLDLPFDPMEAIGGLPARITSGFRTPEHNAAVGGVPNSRHLDGDAVDLVPSGVSMGELHNIASGIAAQWHVPGARALNEGNHVHLQLPGWGGAPGSPQARQETVPSPPAGYTLDPAPQGSSEPPAPANAAPVSEVDRAAIASVIGTPTGATAALNAPPAFPTAPPTPGYQETPPPLDPGFTQADTRRGLAVPSQPPLPSNESYRTDVDPKKLAVLQDAFDKGASTEELQTTILNLGLRPTDVGQLREMVNSRNAGNRGGRFKGVDVHQPIPGPLPGESTPDYYRRMSGGQTIDGPISPAHITGRTTREEIEQIFRGFGYSDPEERADTASLLPVIGGMMAWDEAKRGFSTGHPLSGAWNTAMAGLGILPLGPGGEIKAGSHVVDSLALRAAAAAGEGAPDIARAGQVLGATVDDALRQGGTVILHTAEGPREIVGLGPAGELIDHSGAAIPPEAAAGHIIAPPEGSHPRVEVNIPEGARGLPPPLPQEIPDTRGQGVFYHGTRGEMPRLNEGYYNPANIYGGMDTFYTTDAADIARGYGRKNPNARIYQATERQPVKFFNMEQPLAPGDLERLFAVHPDDSGLVPASIEEATRAGGGKATLRDVMDEIRGASGGEGVTRDEVQELFDTAIHNLRGDGFGGMTHTGGLKTGRQPHSVRIYFDAPTQLHLADVTPAAAAARPVSGEAIASDLPQEAANEAAALGGHPPLPNGYRLTGEGGTVATGTDVVAQGAGAARQRDYLNMPPLPHGYSLDMPGEQSALGFSGRMDQPRSAEEMAALARGAAPESFTPIPSSLVRTEAEAARANPGTQRAVEPPAAPGRAPARPATFADTIKTKLERESQAKGMPVRIDAEDAIDKGVPADLVYVNPNVADKAKLRLRYPSIFGTRYGKMTSKQQHLISLDMDGVDPAAWGFDNKVGSRLGPEDVGDLLGRSLQGDPSAMERGPAFDAWTAHQEAEAQRAEFAGRFPDGPPVERIGSPATLDDLRANEAPATAYEDLLRTGGGKVANINLNNLNTRVDIQRALEATEAHFGGFDAARRGVQTHAETEALANEAGMTADDLLRRRHGQALNAEQALRARQILAKSSEELSTMARNMANWTEAERAQFAEHLLRHAAIYEQVTGATSEAGRALESFKIGASSKAYLQTIHRLTAESGRGRANVDEVARMIVDLHKQGAGPGGVNRFAAEAARPSTTMDKLLEVFYNSILSAPSTHAINMLGNMGSMAMSVPEYGLAALFGKLRGGPDRILGGEVGGYVDGLLHGLGKGTESFTATLKTGEDSDFAAKETIYHRHAIPGVAGSIIRTPTRFLVAEDAFFKGIARQGTIGRLAARQAAREGLTGDALAARVAELRANPPEAMQREARDFARYMTFQRDPGRLGRALQQWTDDYPALKFLIPFIRTQENLVKFAAERSPLGLLMPSVRAELKAGGARRDLALAKISIGSAVGAVAYQAALRGFITGAEPMDPGTRNLLHDAGWQPYSIKVGNRYVSYRRLDPLSLGVSVAADLATFDKYMTPKERDHSWTTLAQLTSRNVASSFWMESVGNLFDLVKDPGKEAPKQAANIAGALLVPNIIAQPTGSMDSVERNQSPDPQAGALAKAFQVVLNRVKSRVPGLRQTLPERLDAFGEPVRNDGRLGPDIISPFQQRIANPDPSYQNLLDNGLRVDVPGKTVNRVPLTAQQHADYTKLSGQYVRDDLLKVRTSPEWQKGTTAERKVQFEQIKRDARADARADLGLDGLSPDNPAPGAVPPLPKGYTLQPRH